MGFVVSFILRTGKIPERYFAPIATGKTRDFYEETPVSDPVFDIYKDMFSYDKMESQCSY